jgi:motility quorum-sensing regulator/GCU-specific mRNA interferase toxin
MPEKKTPHHSLEEIKLAFSTGKGTFTGAATKDAAGLGYGKSEMTAIIQAMDKSHFYKSMTANYNTKVWQDVYHVPDAGGTLYVKLTDNGLVTKFTLLSFKEK